MNYHLELIDIKHSTARQIPSGYGYWHHPEFMAAIAEMHKVTALQLQVYKGEDLFAILPLYERTKLGIRAIVAPVGTYYQGISFAFEDQVSAPRKLLDSAAVCAEIARFLIARYRRVHLRLNPENTDVRGFTWNGFKASPLYTFRFLAQQSLPTLPDERKKLRVAEGLGMRLEEGFDAPAFIALQEALDSRKNHSLGISYRALQEFIERLYAAGLLKQFNVFWDDRLVSSNIMLHDGGEVVYTLFQATTEDALKKGAATFHSLSLLQHLPENAVIFDYCGANVQEVARFKAALGLELFSFYQLRL